MVQIELNAEKTGFLVSGDIRFSNVVQLRTQGDYFIDCIQSLKVKVDFSYLKSSDISGLSLLLRWLAYASKQKKSIQYCSIPESLVKIASVCGVDEFLG